MDGETEFNPYAPPQAARLVSADSPEAMRCAHLAHETSIKAVGGLYALCGGLMLLPVFIGLLEAVTGVSRRDDFTTLGLIMLTGASGLVLGAGVRRLRPWARIAMAVVSGLLSAMSLFTVFFPLLNLYVLWLMLSAKGRMIFSPGYQQIIALTPDMRPRHSTLGVVLLVLLLLFVIAVLAALLVPASHRR